MQYLDIFLLMARLTSVAKRKKEEARASEAKRPASATATPAREEEAASRPPTARLSSRGSGAQPQENTAPAAEPTPEALAFSMPADDPRTPEPPAILAATASPVLAPVPPPPRVLTPTDHGSSTRPGALEEAYAALDQLRTDLQGADRCAAAGRLGLISGWLQADVSVKTA